MRISVSRLLPAQSLDRTTVFYAALGFETLFREDLPGGYLVLRRDTVVLSFVRQGSGAPSGDAVSLCINVDDLERCHAEWRAVLVAAAAPRLGAIRRTRAGREFALIDLDGTSLRICQRPAARHGLAVSSVD
jgi:catechol 2,3-dioxygenase-like lactoylglutathione lyase family enzyme